MDARVVGNPRRVREERSHRLNFPRAFHVRLPGYAPTPLLELPDLAVELGLARLWVKDESRRFQMHGFELLGASWALYREVLGRLMRRVKWDTVDELVAKIEPVGALRIVVVSDNHFGVAAARAARLFGFTCAAYVPAGSSPVRLRVLEAEGAIVTPVVGGYDAALAEAARETDPHTVVLSDSSWPGYDEIPQWVTEGYTTVFEEAVDEITNRGGADPSHLFVPLGVGALAASAGDYFRVERFSADLCLVGVEPIGSPCFVESVAADRRVAMSDPAPSIMEGIARGLPSPLAWDVVSATFDAFVAITDEQASAAVERLAEHGIAASPAGAAALGGLLAVDGSTPGPGGGPIVARGSAASALVVVTEAPLGSDVRDTPDDRP